ncbi:TRI12-domain-containing protein [Stipitochalara longipes BDJ]|nr:TRI12-domain-containing protein [Stipitochalara longipes BDJ]
MNEIKGIFTRRERRGLRDGSVDFVDRNALGGALHQMPEGYFRSVQFVGTVAVNLTRWRSLINEHIGPSSKISWVVTVWTLGSAVGFLLVGRLSDIFGRKWMVMGTSMLGLIGNIVRTNLCNGLAAVGQLSFGIVLAELVLNKQRGPIATLVFLSSLPFSVFGPVIARCSYYLGVIMSLMALVPYRFMYHPLTYDQLHVHGKTKRQQIAELDYGGIFLFAAGMVLFLVGLSWGGTVHPWRSAQVLCTLLIGVATLVALIIYESFIVKQHALIPIRIFKNIGYLAVVACATIAAMIYYSMTILCPTVIGKIYSTNVLTIGWQSSVVGGGILLGQVLGGFAVSYVPKVQYQIIIASCLAFAFVTSLSSISEENHAAFILMGVFGCTAIGFVDNITFPGVTLVVEPQDIGLASGVLGSIRACGGAIAQALYNLFSRTKFALSAGLPLSSMPALFDGVAARNFSNVPGISVTIIEARLQSFPGNERSRTASVTEDEEKTQERICTQGVFG